jgi:hypothetical protein
MLSRTLSQKSFCRRRGLNAAARRLKNRKRQPTGIARMQFEPAPVFFDKTGRRWRFIRCALIIVCLGLVALPAAFIVSVLIIPKETPARFESQPFAASTMAADLIKFRLAVKRGMN